MHWWHCIGTKVRVSGLLEGEWRMIKEGKWLQSMGTTTTHITILVEMMEDTGWKDFKIYNGLQRISKNCFLIKNIEWSSRDDKGCVLKWQRKKNNDINW